MSGGREGYGRGTVRGEVGQGRGQFLHPSISYFLPLPDIDVAAFPAVLAFDLEAAALLVCRGYDNYHTVVVSTVTHEYSSLEHLQHSSVDYGRLNYVQ